VSRTILTKELDSQLRDTNVELSLKGDTVLDKEGEVNVYQAWCTDPSTFNPIASLFWQTEGGLIRDILDESVMCNFTQMFAFTVCWYIFTITTYGTSVPSGLFLPGMIIGCGLGEMYSKIILNIGLIDDAHYAVYRVIYIILGMAAMLASYTRMTYSLAVIVMETSLAVNIFLPCIITIAVANFTG